MKEDVFTFKIKDSHEVAIDYADVILLYKMRNLSALRLKLHDISQKYAVELMAYNLFRSPKLILCLEETVDCIEFLWTVMVAIEFIKLYGYHNNC